MLKQVLESFGLVENVDFTLTVDWFSKIEKSREIQVTIHHPEIPAIYHGSTIITPAVPAWTEVKPQTELYFANFPSDLIIKEILYAEVIKNENIVELVDAYLSTKRNLIDSDDCFNIHENKIHNWSFKNISKPTNEELALVVGIKNSKKNRDTVLAQIADLEAQITPRRIREALVSGDNTFILSIESQITALRASL